MLIIVNALITMANSKYLPIVGKLTRWMVLNRLHIDCLAVSRARMFPEAVDRCYSPDC
jgi:hypothetical protein